MKKQKLESLTSLNSEEDSNLQSLNTLKAVNLEFEDVQDENLLDSNLVSYADEAQEFDDEGEDSVINTDRNVGGDDSLKINSADLLGGEAKEGTDVNFGI